MTYLTLLHELDLVLGGGRNLKQGLPQALQKIMQVFSADAICLSFDSDLPRLDIPLMFGSSELLLPDDHARLQTIPAETRLKKLDVQPETVYVMRVGNAGENFGFLQLAAYQAPAWDAEAQQIFTMIADKLGIALLNAESFHAMQRQGNELAWLNKVGDSLLSLLGSLQIEQVAERIMMAVRDLLEVEETSIMLKDYESEDLILWQHTPVERDLSIRLKPGQGVAGWVFEYGESTIVNDVREDPRWEPAFDEKDGFNTRSLIAVPIILDREVIGVAEAVNKVNGDFTDEDEKVLQTLTKWAAIAIGNANAYDNLKRTTEQLADAKKQAAMAHMVLNLAHKINNAVGAIRVWAMEARDELTSPEQAELKSFVENILSNTEETLLMVRRIRGATELRAGDIQPINVKEILDAAVQFSRLAPSIHVERNYKPDLPLVGADAERLVEVFLNLLNNAADVLERNGTVSLTCRRSQNGMVEVLIQDDGKGIPEHLRSRIFDPFVTSKADGLGLGLWMVKLYVELIGGVITHSTSNKGTAFRITLPPWEKAAHD